MTENELAKIVGLCIKIHRTLGPGLLESVYERILCYELAKAGISYERQKKVNVKYEDVKIDVGFRADVIVAGKSVLELKSAEAVTAVHQKILLTYLRLTELKLGLLINFRQELLEMGLNE